MVVAWVLWVIVIGWLPPLNTGVELLMVVLLTIAVFFMVTLAGKSKKMGVIVTMGIVGMLILRRFGWLDLLSGGIVLVLLGLITLIN